MGTASAIGILAAMFRSPVPSRHDIVAYEILRTPAGAAHPDVIGRATYVGGSTSVEAPENVAVAIEELLERPFVDRVQPDERPPGYRRSGSGAVDFLVPGMPEHFRARMRGLWLSYPDGSVVTARPMSVAPPRVRPPAPAFADPIVTDPAVRQTTLSLSQQAIGRLVDDNPPEAGLRPAELAPSADAAGPPEVTITRSDCGWLC